MAMLYNQRVSLRQTTARPHISSPGIPEIFSSPYFERANTLWWSSMAMDNPQFIDDFSI